MTPFRLLANRGYGSAISEAMLALAGLPYEIEDAQYEIPGPTRDRLFTLNPAGQLPTLVLPNGEVMTESAAIALYLDEIAPEAGLAPPRGAPERAQFLRWLVFLVSNVYPTFTYADFPERFVSGEKAQAELVAGSTERRKSLWRILESAVSPNPWMLGARFSALDVYVCVMTRWRPRRDWFADECPKICSAAEAAEAEPKLAAVWARNFDA